MDRHVDVRRQLGPVALAAGVMAAVGVALLAFDDVQPLRSLGGGDLASPGWIPIVIAGLLAFRASGLPRRRLLWLGCLALGLYAIVLTAITSLLDPTPAYGDRPLEKAVPVLGAFLIWLVVLLCGYVLVTAVPRQLLIGAVVMFGIMAVGALLYRVGVHYLDDLPLIHSGANAQQRVRSTRFEASSLGAGMLASTALAVVLVRRPRVRFWAAFAGLLSTVVLSDSRGTELIAVVGLVLLLVGTLLDRLLRLGPRIVAVVAGLVVVLALGGSLGLAIIVQSPAWHAAGLSDGGSGTSDATRAGWAFAASRVLVTSPLGLGFGAYLQETPRLLHEAITALSGSYGPSALAELANAARGLSDTGVSPKTAPTLAAFHLGWIGLVALAIVWFLVLVRGFGARERGGGGAPAFVVIACVILVASAYYSSWTAWEQGLLLGIVLGTAAVRGARSGTENRSGPVLD